MKIILINRIADLPKQEIEISKFKLDELLFALWQEPESERSKFSKIQTRLHRKKTLNLDIIQTMIAPAQVEYKSIDPQKIYGRRLFSITLHGKPWNTLQIDETSYLKHRPKTATLITNIITKHAIIKSSHKIKKVQWAPSLTHAFEKFDFALPSTPPDPKPESEIIPIKRDPSKTISFTMSILMGSSITVALTLLNVALIATLLYAALGSIMTFIITQKIQNKKLNPIIMINPDADPNIRVKPELKVEFGVNPSPVPINTAFSRPAFKAGALLNNALDDNLDNKHNNNP